MNPTETASRLRRLVNDWRKEEKQLCELFMDEIIPHSLRARRIKDAQAIDAAIEMIERMAKLEAAEKELRDDYPELTDKQFGIIYDKAYEDGHSAGYDEVGLHFQDLYYFCMKFVKAGE